ncbi:MAG: nucleotide sugar dehydrogenase [Deltaproteobacteria bacterium]|nr:nucleotide sugar dehydrogenase [Deltaproteobacteria bacterium]MBZ0219172.1 nucleotide sugar dehydrogenase [Deltaproteobacteria bacterium]
MAENHNGILKKIESKQARIGVIGLGYVGLPIMLRFCEEGFKVTGIDVDGSKVEAINAGNSYIKHIPGEKIGSFVRKGLLNATTDTSALTRTDAIIICVPTPLSDKREPDLSYVYSSATEVAKHLRRGQVISLESTTYPGTTEEVLLPLLGKNGFKAGRDFYLVFAPEREDPGRMDYTTKNTPKIVGGVTERCTKVGSALYSQIVSEVVAVSSTRVAEMSKLLENIYRSVNIALVNELKMLSDRMGIDIWEVIEASNTKPFGFQAFYPGPGLGGHCIPIDPFYLTWKAREYDFSTRFIELAGEINTNMPYYVVGKVMEALNSRGKSLKGSSILLLGVAYKKNVDDLRESPSLELIRILKSKGANVSYNDPHVPIAVHHRTSARLRSVPLTAKNIKKYDCVIIATDHSAYDYRWIVSNSRLVVDTRNATAGISGGQVVKA